MLTCNQRLLALVVLTHFEAFLGSLFILPERLIVTFGFARLTCLAHFVIAVFRTLYRLVVYEICDIFVLWSIEDSVLAEKLSGILVVSEFVDVLGDEAGIVVLRVDINDLILVEEVHMAHVHKVVLHERLVAK
jgi:hypothetical protein